MAKSVSEKAKGYDEFLRGLKERIRNAQVHAALAVNRELVLLYWQIGRDILVRQQEQGWGAQVVDRLAADLRRAFPEIQGFSSRNLIAVFIRMHPFLEGTRVPLAACPPVLQHTGSKLPVAHRRSEDTDN
jgi:hypothetical protein